MRYQARREFGSVLWVVATPRGHYIGRWQKSGYFKARRWLSKSAAEAWIKSRQQARKRRVARGGGR